MGVVNLDSLWRSPTRKVRRVTASATIEIYGWNVSGCSCAAIGTHLVEALIYVLCNLTTCTVNANPLAIVYDDLEYTGNSSAQPCRC